MSASHPSMTAGNVYRAAYRLAVVMLWVAAFAALPARAKELALQSFMSTLSVCKEHLRN